ncbi:ribosome maturation factor RimM [Aquibacillus kalidii]|uniref:ribosome maturation factor RimM n=1 Tax=Aquibacillus kalidii TaxID=2762597 RepID=UPI0016448218|nr:ribosome maturation factor RimM [Aquibacillus kalidii]
MADRLFNVGKIVNTHGIKGEVKVVRITDFEERFQVGQELYFVGKENGTPIKLVVDGHRLHKNFDLLHFKQYDSINDAEKLKEGMLKVKEDQLEPLDDGSYYYHEIIGCEVATVSGDKIGTVKEILSPGANDVWVIKQNGDKDVLIPYIDDVVKEVDVTNKSIIIEPMEGLLD